MRMCVRAGEPSALALFTCALLLGGGGVPPLTPALPSFSQDSLVFLEFSGDLGKTVCVNDRRGRLIALLINVDRSCGGGVCWGGVIKPQTLDEMELFWVPVRGLSAHGLIYLSRKY